MHIEKYSRVRMVVNRYSWRGVTRGMLGYVQEVWDDGEAYEVNFSDKDSGETIKLLEVLPREIEPA